MAGKIQIPAVGGLRKVIKTGAAVNPGTTIAEYGSGTITLAQLRAALGVTDASTTKTGGSGSPTAALNVGPGLSGGGLLIGAVPLQLVAPIPFMIGDDSGGGGDGDPGPPGQAGAQGSTGDTGPAGPAVFFLPDDPEEALDAIPGAVGPPGGTGAPGPAGPAIFLLPDDPEAPFDAIPGPAGAAGAAGAAGPPGPAGPAIFLLSEGEDGEAGPPGPQGAAGSGGGSTIQLPGTIPDLQFWLDASQFSSSNVGYALGMLPNIAPNRQGPDFFSLSGGAQTSSTTLNGLPTFLFPGTQQYAAAGAATLNPAGIDLSKGATFFVVFNATALAYQEFFSSNASGAVAFRMDNAGHTQLLNPTVSAFATATIAVAANTWFQANATYLPSSGAYAFRTGRAAAGSGTSVQTINARTNVIGYDAAAGGTNLHGQIAEMICYARVLSGAEIASVENYLNSKWGV